MKRTIVRIMLFVVPMVCMSCFTYRTFTTREQLDKKSGKKSIDVLMVQTKQGQTYYFNREHPAKILETAVTGIPEVRWKYGETDSIAFRKKEAVAVWKNGTPYELIEKDTAGFVALMPNPVSIPFSDVSQLDYKKYEPHLTGLIVMGAQVSVTFILLFCVEPITDYFFGFD